MKLRVMFLGTCDYQKSLDIQLDTLRKRQDELIEDTLILVEHPPVITLGKRAQREDLLTSKDFLSERGIDLFETQRGGNATYHGPGQIVGYLIFNVKKNGIGVRTLVQNIEDTIIKFLEKEYKISSKKDSQYTGVWVGEEKIAAIGLAIKKGVSMHGFAININTNLDHFRYIVPCGILNRGVTSVQKIIGQNTDLDRNMKSLLEDFCDVFEYDGYERV